MDRTFWKPKIFKAEEIVDYKSNEGIEQFNLKETVGLYEVSTVMLPDTYNGMGLGMYETMIIKNGEFMEYQKRYRTEEEARVGHQETIMKVQQNEIKESKASEADWDHLTAGDLKYIKRQWNHLTAEDEVGLDRDIATLKTAFYREIEEGNSVDSTRILGELDRLRGIKKTRFGSYESKANEDDHKKSWDELDSIAKKGFSDIGYCKQSWDSEPEEIREEMETVVKDNMSQENWKAVANKFYREELNKGKKSGGESKANELDLKNYTINPFDDVWVSECKQCGAEFTEFDYDNSENSVRNHLMSEHGIDDSHLGNTLYNQNEAKASEMSTSDWDSKIQKLAGRSGVKRIPVENFLSTIGANDDENIAMMNFEMDSSMYNWNGQTQKAILEGISIFFNQVKNSGESMTQMDDLSDSPSTVDSARHIMKDQLKAYNDNPTPEGDQYGTPLGFPWQYGEEAKISSKRIPKVDLYQGGQKVGIIEDYNPKQHEGYVTLDGIGIKEFGAMPSEYVAYLNGERVPNKWDNQIDYNASFFGEGDMEDYQKYDDWDDESEVRNTESWGNWSDNEAPMIAHDQIKLMRDLGIADKTLRQMGYDLKRDGEGLVDNIEKQLNRFGVNLDRDPDQVEESKANEELDDLWMTWDTNTSSEWMITEEAYDEWKNYVLPDGHDASFGRDDSRKDFVNFARFKKSINEYLAGMVWDSKHGIITNDNKDMMNFRVEEGFDQGLYGHVDAKCNTCGVEFDSIPDMNDHYAMNSDHISNLDDLDSDIPNSD